MRMTTAMGLGLLFGMAAAACKGEAERPPSHLAQMAARCAHEGELSCAVPIFNVHSLAASERYYRDSLGFKIDWEDGEPATFASVSRGHAAIFLCQGCQGTPGAWTMTFGNVDALYKDFSARGARIRMPPTNMPWGLREMHVSDIDGNVVRFGMSLDEH
jgi:uncharacterized glyoxalase superfamily protein PhnB